MSSLSSLDAFKDKYMPFFVEDYRSVRFASHHASTAPLLTTVGSHRWTTRNYDHIASRSDEFRRWWDAVHPIRTELGLHLFTVEEVMEFANITDDCRMSSRELVDRVFEVVMAKCLVPGWLQPSEVQAAPAEVQLARGVCHGVHTGLCSVRGRRVWLTLLRVLTAFGRYMMGQLMLFTRYDFSAGAQHVQQTLVDAVVRNRDGMTLEQVETTRRFYEEWVCLV